MLKLVVNNDLHVNKKDTITCKNSCDLFDEITGECSINQGVDIDSPYEAARCGFFIHRDSMSVPEIKDHTHFKFSLMDDIDDDLLDDQEIFHQLVGKSIYKEEYTYPLKPDFSSYRDDAKWFVSPCGSYGCWIVNHYKKPLSIPKSKDVAERGWNNRVYKSPIPLHDHQSALPISSKMAWLIDEDGFGQYALLVNGKISSISAPKPINWKRH
ncbi:hypothetical protein [Mesobacillus zeae]|uniref:hypothetical protein n=1 Tax=Mesobacillus zeae TaxID=1917180 RepID=UPI00300BAC65